MSVEIPSALIRRVQVKLREDDGVPSSYDPTDPSLLSSLPTLDDALSDFDAADGPSHPRCGKCRRGAGLLRGHKSTVCVFFGHNRRSDGIVQSISFNSTAACKKLLEYLHWMDLMNGTDEKGGIDSIIHGAAHFPENNTCASKLESTNSKAAWTPDLLFMPEGNICIPKKGNNFNLKS